MNCRKIMGLILSIFAGFYYLSADIKEIKSIKDVLSYGDGYATLFVFDIDNTILQCSNSKGTDQCFSAAVSYLQQKYNIDSLTAVQVVLPMYRKVVLNSGARLVEEVVPSVIRELQEKGHNVIALTARSGPLVEHSCQQLLSLDIKMSFIGKTFEVYLKHGKARFLFGSMFCGDNNKGDALACFLNNMNMKPIKIVFIDDKRKYLEQVEAVAQSMGIEFTGLRYGYCDEQVKSFALDDADKKLLDAQYGLSLNTKIVAQTT